MQIAHQSKRLSQLHALTSLRFVAAALIVIHHSVGSFGIDSEINEYFPTGQGVSFFFVLSGFILTYVYSSLDGKGPVGRFLLARFARIWPLHVATLLLVIIIFPTYLRSQGGEESATIALANMFMLHGWIPTWKYFFSYNAPSWSISTEFGFYLFFPLLIYRWRRTWHIKLLWTFLTIVGIIAYCKYQNLPDGSGGGISYIGLAYIHPFARLFEFTLGMTLALVYANLKEHYHPGKVWGTATELLVLGMVAGVMASSRYCSRLVDPWIGPSGVQWFYNGGISCLFFGLLILSMALEEGIISRALSWSLLRVLGEISFSVYLLHQILLRYYRWKFEDSLTVPDWTLYTYFWVILVLSSYVSWVVVERPCRKFIVGLGQGRLYFQCRNCRVGAGKGKRLLSIFRYVIDKLIEMVKTKEKRTITLAVILLGLLLSPILYLRNTITSINVVSPSVAAEVLSKTDPEHGNIRFGNRFVLLGSNIVRDANGFQIQLVWKSINRQRLVYNNAIHLVDRSGNILSKLDYHQDEKRPIVKAGTLWLDKIDIPAEKLKNVVAVAIGVYSANLELLSANKGPRDWNGKRLWIALPGL